MAFEQVKVASSEARADPPLLALPPELMCRIFQLLFARTTARFVEVQQSRGGYLWVVLFHCPCLGVLQVCRVLRVEGIQILRRGGYKASHASFARQFPILLQIRVTVDAGTP